MQSWGLGDSFKKIPQKEYSELREKKKKWDNINRMAEKEEKRQHIPERVSSALQLHDSCLLSLKKEGQNLVMIVAIRPKSVLCIIRYIKSRRALRCI